MVEKPSQNGEAELSAPTESETQRLLHKLQVNKIQLEMRNAELVAALALAGESIPDGNGNLVNPDSEQARLRLEELRRKATSIQSMYDQILQEDR